jgi:hypothetical protein
MEMSLKVQKGKHDFLAHHGLIKLIDSYSLEKLKNRILWEYFINMDLKEFEEAQTTMGEEERKKWEEPKRITRPKISKQQKKDKKHKIDEKDKDVVDDLTSLGTPLPIP